MDVLLLTLVLMPMLSGMSAAQTAPPFIVFGDSTVDTGNNNYINTTLDFLANFPPNGQQYFGKPTGRFSNGRIFLDFICEYAGVPHVIPYLQPDADHSKGVNFGSGGAGVLRETNEGMTIPLETQRQYFTEFQEAIYERWGSKQAKKYLSDAIYFISIANNDYMSGYFSVAKLREQYSPQEFVGLMISEIIKTCEFLYWNGARKLVVFGVGPLGCIPALRQFHPTQDCFQAASDLVVGHNMALSMGLKAWEATHPDLTLLEIGFHDFMLERINNPTAYGFINGSAACCGTGVLRAQGHCGRPNAVTGEEYDKCGNPDEYVFWDFYHGSEKLHEDFAKMIWDKPISESPSTLTIRQLLELSSSSDCGDEELAAFTGGPVDPLDMPIQHSSF